MQPDHRELRLGELRHRRLRVHRELDPVALRQRVRDVHREEAVAVGLRTDAFSLGSAPRV